MIILFYPIFSPFSIFQRETLKPIPLPGDNSKIKKIIKMNQDSIRPLTRAVGYLKNMIHNGRIERVIRFQIVFVKKKRNK